MAQNSSKQGNGEMGEQFTTSSIPPLMSPFAPWPSYSQYHSTTAAPTQGLWQNGPQCRSSWPADQPWFRPPLLGYAPNGYGHGMRGPHQPRGGHSQGPRLHFRSKRPTSSEGDSRQPKKQKGALPHQKHQKHYNKNDTKRSNQRSPPASVSTGNKKNGKTPSRSAKDDERRAAVAKVTAHVKNSARKDLNMKLLENEATRSKDGVSNCKRSSVKEAVADIQLTAEDLRSIGSCTKPLAKATSSSSGVLQDIGFIDPSPDTGSSEDLTSLQAGGDSAPHTVERSRSKSKSPELNSEAASSAVEQHESIPTDVLKMKQQVLQKILTMDKSKRTQLIEDPKSSSSRFVIDHLVKAHRTAVSRRLTQLRFHVDVEAHTLYNEIGGTVSEFCDDLDISQLPQALLEQVQEIITSENTQSTVTLEQEDEDIQILEPPTKPPPPCIDLDEVVEEVSPSMNEIDTKMQEIATEESGFKQNNTLGSSVLAVPALEEVPSDLGAPVLVQGVEEPAGHPEERAEPVLINSGELPVVASPVAKSGDPVAMEVPEAAEEVSGTLEEPRNAAATVSLAESAAVSHTYHLKVLKDLFKQEQNQYAALKSLEKIEKEILAKRQNVMKSLARLKKRQFEVLGELQMNRQPPAPSEERPGAEVLSTEAVDGPVAEETPGTSAEAQVQQTVIESTCQVLASSQLTVAQEPTTQRSSTSTTAPRPRLLELANQLTADGFRVKIYNDKTDSNEKVCVDETESQPAPLDRPQRCPITARRRTTSGRLDDSAGSFRSNSSSSGRQEGTSMGQTSTKTAAEVKEELAAQSALEDANCPAQGTKEDEGNEEEQLAYRPLLPHKGAVECLHAMGPVLFTGSADKMVHVYDIESRCLMQRVDVHKGSVKFVYALPLRTPTHLLPASVSSAEYLGHLDVITGCSDGFVRRIDMSTSRVVHEISTRYPVTCMVRTHPQSRVFLLGAALGYIYLYNPKHALLQLADYKADSDVICLVVTQLFARKVVIISAKNCPVTVRDYRSGVLLLTLHLGPIMRRICAISTLGDYIYCADAARNVVVCDSANSGSVVREIKLPTCAMRICENGKLMYLGCYDGVVRILDTTTLSIVKNIAVYNRKDLTCMQVEDNQKIYLGNRAGEVGYLEGAQQ